MAGRHGRFVILTDEHVPLALVQALRQTAWTVMRVEDDPGLGKGTDDRIVFAHAAARGWGVSLAGRPSARRACGVAGAGTGLERHAALAAAP